MTLTPEQITKYSEIMARFEGLPVNHFKYGLEVQIPPDDPDKNGYWTKPKYHESYDWLHRVWVKFRDLKFEYSPYFFELCKYHESLSEIIINLTMKRTIEEAFLELGKAIEWYQNLKQ